MWAQRGASVPNGPDCRHCFYLKTMLALKQATLVFCSLWAFCLRGLVLAGIREGRLSSSKVSGDGDRKGNGSRDQSGSEDLRKADGQLQWGATQKLSPLRHTHCIKFSVYASLKTRLWVCLSRSSTQNSLVRDFWAQHLWSCDSHLASVSASAKWRSPCFEEMLWKKNEVRCGELPSSFQHSVYGLYSEKNLEPNWRGRVWQPYVPHILMSVGF